MLKKTYAKVGSGAVSLLAKNKFWDSNLVTFFSKHLAKNKNNSFVSSFILFAQRLNENFELKLFKERLVPGMNVIDIGANFGLYSFEAAKELGIKGHVYSFEPEPETFEVLSAAVGKRGFSNITLFQKALSDQKGRTKLYFDDVNVGGHSLSKENPYKSSSYHEVETTTLDEVFSDIKVDLIKIDTQGAEGLVFKGGKEMLKRDKPLVFLEFWPNGMDEFEVDSSGLLKLFAGLGYRILVIDKIKRGVYEVGEEELITQCYSRKHENDFLDVILEPRNK